MAEAADHTCGPSSHVGRPVLFNLPLNRGHRELRVIRDKLAAMPTASLKDDYVLGRDLYGSIRSMSCSTRMNIFQPAYTSGRQAGSMPSIYFGTCIMGIL